MLLKSILGFKLGSQYEDYEFQLTWLTEIMSSNIIFDVYKFEDIASQGGLKPEKVLLYFNSDILMKVQYTFMNKDKSSVVDFLNDLVPEEGKIRSIQKGQIYHYQNSLEETLKCEILESSGLKIEFIISSTPFT